MSKFSKENPPAEDDFTPDALAFREEQEQEQKDEKPKGEDGHEPHPVFSESEPPRVAEEVNNEPAPTHFSHLQ